MKIALLGYGRMGKAIEKIAVERGHEIIYRLDHNLEEGTLQKADVAINFSVPQAAVENIKKGFDNELPVVCGTTGWLEELHIIENLCKAKKTAFLYASNFSVGVNLFFKLTRFLANMMQPHAAHYKASLNEIHHIHKLDAPSGTAITIAENIIDNSHYDQWSMEPKEENQLPIHSQREGEVPGTHIVEYESEIDSIKIIHEANNRKGFALGAVIAAEWIIGKTGVFSMEDVLNLS